MTTALLTRRTTARLRLGIAAAAGLVIGLLVSLTGAWRLVPLAAWDVAALIYVSWVWYVIGRLDPKQTARHAALEDPTRATADALLLAASIISLLAVGLAIASAGRGPAAGFQVALGVLSVIVSWAVVHTMFALRYARLYYGGQEKGIDFNELDGPPRYTDFAYLAFTIGMTFQVSDTALRTRAFRATALRHALLSYLFGTVIVATTINLVAGLRQ